MEINEAIKEAYDLVEDWNFPTGDQIESVKKLIELAEQYQSIKTLMPEKKEILKLSTAYRYGKSTQFGIRMWNAAIDECTLAILKAIPAVEELKSIILKWNSIIADGGLAEDIAIAIHALILERLNVKNKEGK